MTTRRRSRYAALAAGLVAVALAAGVLPAAPAAARAPVNACANPDLATGADGWETVVGRGGRSPSERGGFQFSINNIPEPMAAVRMPRLPVEPGQTWSLGVLARSPYDNLARLRVEVDWLSAGGATLGHADGDYRRLGGGRTSVPVSGVFTAPGGAAVADVVVRGADLLSTSGAFYSTRCTYHLVTGAGEPTATS